MWHASKRTKRAVGWGVAAALLVGIGFTVGALTVASTRLASSWQHPSDGTQIPWPYRALHASATDSSESFVVATGLVEVGVEAIFFLDALSGDLQCTVYNPRARQFNALFKRNILADLQLEQGKRPQFLLVTGEISKGRYSDFGAQAASCLTYVVEANSGRFAAYAVPWNPNQFSRGQAQAGEMLLLQVGTARTAAVRE